MRGGGHQGCHRISARRSPHSPPIDDPRVVRSDRPQEGTGVFGAIGTFVYRMRFAVIAVLIALMAGLGLYGLDLNKHLSQSGWFDPTSQSVKGAQVADASLGRDHRSDVIVLITPPEGTLVDDPAFGAKMENWVNDLIERYPDVVQRSTTETDPAKALRDNQAIIDPFFLADDSAASQAAQTTIREHTFTPDRTRAFVSIGVAGNDDTAVLNNYKKIEPFLESLGSRPGLEGTTFQLAGLQPVAGAMASGMDEDIRRAELIALPVVAIMLFFIFGGVVAACLPVLIGGLTIAGSLGIMKIIAQVTELNIFAQSVVTLIGLGIAIDYGLFIVSRFREELAEGYSTQAAVRRSVMTAGQTVVFSATIIVAAVACLLMMPQGFLKSVAYGAIFSVSLAALLSITVLPAILSILGPRIDALGLPFLRRTKTRKEVEEGFWGKLAGWVMRHPVATAVPTVLLLLVLALPFSGIKFGGISEEYLPPDNPSRIAQEDFDRYFPAERTEEIKLVIAYDPNNQSSSDEIDRIASEANQIPGFTKKFSSAADEGALTGQYGDTGAQVIQMSAGLVDRNTAGEAIKQLRALDHSGVSMWVTGTPTLTQDSIDALLSRLPLMAILLVLVTGLLMFLQFGSLVLPIKAALMTVLGLGATLGILTWIFVDGHGAGIGNFTPGPLFAAVLVLIIAIIFGLSTDYEVFLLSRMVEARQKGASTTEAVRVGTAHTGRIITAAAAILVVVTGAFGLSEIVMMKYIAYGMIAALILDATVIRMLLVPSVMKMLGDDCWWAPRWMRVLQQKIGLGETVLDDEPDQKRRDARVPVGAGVGAKTGLLAAGASTAALGTSRRAFRGRRGGSPDGPDSTDHSADDYGFGSGSGGPGGDRPGGPRTGGPGGQRGPGGSGPGGVGMSVPAPMHTPLDRDDRAREPERTAVPSARVGVSDPPSGSQYAVGGRRARRADRAAGVVGSPGAGSDSRGTDSRYGGDTAGPRLGRRARSEGPDTGGWSLGDGGIRLSATEPGNAGGGTPDRPRRGVDIPRPDTRRGARQSDARQPDSRLPDSRHPDSRLPDSRLSDSRLPDSRHPDARQPSPGRAPGPAPTTAPPAPRFGAGTRPAPATGARPAGPSPREMPRSSAPDDGSPLGRRPELDQTGRRPLAASLSPEQRRGPGSTPPPPPGPAGQPPVRQTPSPLDRGLTPGLTPQSAQSAPADPRSGTPGTPGRADRSDADRAAERGRRSTDRHARTDDDTTDGNGQISVQDLLRRSRSEQ
ncbi:hypothetical protein GCM10009624_24720 [Gordonia sinesedis]